MLSHRQQKSPAALSRHFARHAEGAWRVPAGEAAPGPSSLGLYSEAPFERALGEDIAGARSHIVIFSGYITAARVKRLAPILKPRIVDGVKVRCVTRPPRANGTIPESNGRAAIELLESIGAIVDCRSRIHQKVCLIDAGVVWLGSLNALSHMYMGDEVMARVVDPGLAGVLAAHMCKRRCSPERAMASIAMRENPPCPACGGRTVLHDRRESLALRCEVECGWTEGLW